jgi:hypothetical protein
MQCRSIRDCTVPKAPLDVAKEGSMAKKAKKAKTKTKSAVKKTAKKTKRKAKK